MIYLSKDFFQRTIVPPAALDLVIAKSGSNFSSVFSSHEYSPLKSAMQLVRSEVKICGSERNTRSGDLSFVNVDRLYMFLFSPSIFQVRQETVE